VSGTSVFIDVVLMASRAEGYVEDLTDPANTEKKTNSRGEELIQKAPGLFLKVLTRDLRRMQNLRDNIELCEQVDKIMHRNNQGSVDEKHHTRVGLIRFWYEELAKECNEALKNNRRNYEQGTVLAMKKKCDEEKPKYDQEYEAFDELTRLHIDDKISEHKTKSLTPSAKIQHQRPRMYRQNAETTPHITQSQHQRPRVNSQNVERRPRISAVPSTPIRNQDL
jgi:hypothetical protein